MRKQRICMTILLALSILVLFGCGKGVETLYVTEPGTDAGVRVWNTLARFFTSSRKSTRSSAVKKKRILLPSKAHSALTSCMSRLCSAIFWRQIS